MLTGSFLEYCTSHNMSNRAKGLVTTRARVTLAGIEGWHATVKRTQSQGVISSFSSHNLLCKL